MPLAALFFTPLPARSSLCALEALRWVVGGANIPTPGGVGTPPKACYNFPVLGTPASNMGSELPRRPRYGAPSLRFAPVPCRKCAERS
jgi:hypothetical protein